MSPHIFQLDPESTRYGGPKLCTCGLPRANAIHIEPPDVPEGDRSAEIIGEGRSETVDT